MNDPQSHEITLQGGPGVPFTVLLDGSPARLLSFKVGAEVTLVAHPSETAPETFTLALAGFTEPITITLDPNPPGDGG